MHQTLTAEGAADSAAYLAKVLRSSAIVAVAEYTRKTADFFVQDGPTYFNASEVERQKKQIVEIADNLVILAGSQEPNYRDFENLLQRLQTLGFFPDGSLVSDAAHAFSLSGDGPAPVDDFISEDEIATFEGFLRYQGVDPASSTPDEIEMWRGYFEEARRLAGSSPRLGLMKLKPVPGEQKYAVAIRRDSRLWLTMWARCSRAGDVYVFYPRNAGNPHASYHRDGRVHQKSHGTAVIRQIRQLPLEGFKGSEHLGIFNGHGTSSGAVCDPSAFDEVIIVEAGILGPRHGSVGVDLVEPGRELLWSRDTSKDFYFGRVNSRKVFKRHNRPSVVITVQR